METFHYRLAGKVYDLTCRDSQRSKVYAAEREAFGPAFGKKIADGGLAALTRVVRRVESSKTWKKLLAEAGCSPRPIEVLDGRGCRRAFARGWEIVFPVWSRTLPVVLHEMAHVARPLADHNWPFVEAYVRLVSRFIGVEAAANLKREFKLAGVRIRPKKTFSPEVREKLRQRGLALAAARQNPRMETT